MPSQNTAGNTTAAWTEGRAPFAARLEGDLGPFGGHHKQAMLPTKTNWNFSVENISGAGHLHRFTPAQDVF